MAPCVLIWNFKSRRAKFGQFELPPRLTLVVTGYTDDEWPRGVSPTHLLTTSQGSHDPYAVARLLIVGNAKTKGCAFRPWMGFVMRHQCFAETSHGVNETFRHVVLLILLAVLSATGTRAQSLGFVPASPRSGHTVTVRELQISSKARDSFQRGLRRLIRHDPEGSLKHFAAAVAAAPDYYEAYYHLGVAEAQLSRNEEALRSFQTAIDLSDGHYPRAEFGYALVLTRIGNAVDAERVVRHGLQTDANIADGHVVLGLVLLKLNRVEEAEKSAQEALLLEQPSSGKGHLILADVQGARGDFAAQKDELEAYLKRYPDDRNRKYLEIARNMARKLAAQKLKGQ